MNLRLKICGMKDPDQINFVENQIRPDMIGFIFYKSSPRYPGEDLALSPKGAKTKRVGVFVKNSLKEIFAYRERYELDFAQLHGDEDAGFVQSLKSKGMGVIKVFRVGADFDMRETEDFEGTADYFLFDARVKQFGGAGKSFDWDILNNYKGKTPWFLSGGLTPHNLEKTLSLDFSYMAGVDINSGFEVSPGVKDLEKIIEIKEKYKI